MQLFRPIDYIKIAIANHYGLDKQLWNQRINWVNNNIENIIINIEAVAVNADEPMMFRKMVNQFNKAMNDEPVDGLVSLDSTASGVQILGALTACRKTCQRTNLIDDGIRHDLYGEAADYMSESARIFGLTRNDLKQPVMTKQTWSLQQ